MFYAIWSVPLGFEHVEGAHGRLDAFGNDHLGRVGGALHRDVEQLAVLGRDAVQHVGGTALLGRRLADTDPHTQEVLGVEVLRDAAQPVVTGEATADLDPHGPDGQVQL